MASHNKRTPLVLKVTGPLQAPISELVAEKRRIGYRFNSEVIMLQEFDRFSDKHLCPTNILTKEIVLLWNEKQPTHSAKTHQARCRISHMLGEYMTNHGYQAYVTKKGALSICRHGAFVPYIFSDDELTRFFRKVDAIPKNGYSPHQYLFYPLLFRLLYGCGLRLSEALMLKIHDVNLKTGVLTIRGTKFDKDRLVPMHETLVARFRQYAKERLSSFDEKSLFFPAPDGNFYSGNTIYSKFRLILKKAGISHGGRGKGPRVHDFRHTFAIHCLRQWMRNNTNIENALQYLSVYMGHYNTKATHTYLRLTAELFPEIISKSEAFANEIIPSLEEVDYESI